MCSAEICFHIRKHINEVKYMSIYQSSAVEVVEKLQSNEVDAQQLFKDQQARIQKLDSEFNAFVHVENTPQTTKLDGPLAGLPISVKDQIHVEAMPCTSGYERTEIICPDSRCPCHCGFERGGSANTGQNEPAAHGNGFPNLQ